MNKEEIKDMIDKAYFGIGVYEDSTFRNGIRISPTIKLVVKDGRNAILQFELLDYGVNSTKFEENLFINSISSCNLALKFVDPPLWWRKALEMINDGKHTTREGIVRIIERRNEESKCAYDTKWTKEKAIEVM